MFDIERGQLKGIRPLFWQTDTSISKNSWGYVTNQDYKSPTSLIHDLIDIVSKNGDAFYAIVLGWPENGEAVVQSLGTSLALYPDGVKQVERLGFGESV